MKKLIILSLLSIMLLISSLNQRSYAFNDPPFDFLFGNHIDTHQETKLKKNGELQGFLYVIFPDVPPDTVSGLPIARHPRGAAENEECGVDVNCVRGWKINGKANITKFLYHSGVNGTDHSVWLTNRVDIPQPGSYTHFHWIANDDNAPTQTTDIRAGEIPLECNEQNGGALENGGAANANCPGWFIQLEALQNFAFEHGGETIPVYEGIDNSTHVNIVTNYPEGLGIDPTREQAE